LPTCFELGDASLKLFDASQKSTNRFLARIARGLPADEGGAEGDPNEEGGGSDISKDPSPDRLTGISNRGV
jgi:hypothetical protein